MGSRTDQTGNKADKVVKKWDGTCRVENGVLHIIEKRYLRLKSRYFFILILTISSLLYAAYLLYTGAETTVYRYWTMIGLFGGSLVLSIVYGGNLLATIPFTNHSKEDSIPVDCIQEVSTKVFKGARHYTQHRLIIKYVEEGDEKKRIVEFFSEQNLRKVENILS